MLYRTTKKDHRVELLLHRTIKKDHRLRTVARTTHATLIACRGLFRPVLLHCRRTAPLVLSLLLLGEGLRDDQREDEGGIARDLDGARVDLDLPPRDGLKEGSEVSAVVGQRRCANVPSATAPQRSPPQLKSTRGPTPPRPTRTSSGAAPESDPSKAWPVLMKTEKLAPLRMRLALHVWCFTSPPPKMIIPVACARTASSLMPRMSRAISRMKPGRLYEKK